MFISAQLKSIHLYPDFERSLKLVKFTTPVSDPCIAFFTSSDLLQFDPPPMEFLDSFDFTHCTAGRKMCYYGTIPYAYGPIFHAPLAFEFNPYLDNSKSLIQSKLPFFRFNSALVNHYPKADSFIPFHSDDVTEIISDSYILTFSFGSVRKLEFNSRWPPKCVICNISFLYRSVLLLSKPSQFLLKHGILPANDHEITEFTEFGRLSLTFKYLSPPGHTRVS